MGNAGLEMFTKASALELAPFGVRINAVAPTYIDNTNLYRATGMTEPEIDQLKKRMQKSNPMERVATVTEVAKAIIFLSSEQ